MGNRWEKIKPVAWSAGGSCPQRSIWLDDESSQRVAVMLDFSDVVADVVPYSGSLI